MSSRIDDFAQYLEMEFFYILFQLLLNCQTRDYNEYFIDFEKQKEIKMCEN